MNIREIKKPFFFPLHPLLISNPPLQIKVQVSLVIWRRYVSRILNSQKKVHLPENCYFWPFPPMWISKLANKKSAYNEGRLYLFCFSSFISFLISYKRKEKTVQSPKDFLKSFNSFFLSRKREEERERSGPFWNAASVRPWGKNKSCRSTSSQKRTASLNLFLSIWFIL
jgi:hypothetical protein